MRLIFAVLIVCLGAPEIEAKDKAQCSNRCDSTYQFCVSRATTKQAKKSCKADRKLCKSYCK